MTSIEEARGEEKQQNKQTNKQENPQKPKSNKKINLANKSLKKMFSFPRRSLLVAQRLHWGKKIKRDWMLRVIEDLKD